MAESQYFKGITENPLNRLVKATYVGKVSEKRYNAADYIFSTGCFIAPDMRLDNNPKPCTYITGLMQLVESFNARVNCYLPEHIASNSCLVLFYDSSFEHDEFVFDEDRIFTKSKSKTNSAKLANKPINNSNIAKSKQFKKDNLDNKKSKQCLFNLFKNYIQHLKSNIASNSKYSRIVLVEYDINYINKENIAIHQKFHNNFGTIGSIARFLPLFDDRKKATFTLNCNYSLSPVYLSSILQFINSNCIIFPNLNHTYRFNYYEKTPIYNVLPSLVNCSRFPAGMFGIKNKSLFMLDKCNYISIDLSAINDIYNFNKLFKNETDFIEYYNNYNNFIDINLTMSTKNRITKIDELVHQYDILQHINKFIDIFYKLRDNDSLRKENINIGTEYSIDEILLSIMYDPLFKIFIKDSKLNFKIDNPSFSKFIDVIKHTINPSQIPLIEGYIEHLKQYRETNKENPELNNKSDYAILRKHTPNFIIINYDNFCKGQYYYHNKYKLFNYHDIYDHDSVNRFSCQISLQTEPNTLPISKNKKQIGLYRDEKLQFINDELPDITILYKLKFEKFDISDILKLDTKDTNVSLYVKKLCMDSFSHYYLSRSLFTDDHKSLNTKNNATKDISISTISPLLFDKNKLVRAFDYIKSNLSFHSILPSFDMDKNLVLFSKLNTMILKYIDGKVDNIFNDTHIPADFKVINNNAERKSKKKIGSNKANNNLSQKASNKQPKIDHLNGTASKYYNFVLLEDPNTDIHLLLDYINKNLIIQPY